MRRTEVYQVRLDVHEKKQAFAVFKQLGISPAQAIRLFFRQVVVTRSIPFAIEQGNANPVENHKKTEKKSASSDAFSHLSDQDVFDQLNQLLQNTNHLQDSGQSVAEEKPPESSPIEKDS